MVGSTHHWVTQPQGLNRPKVVSKKTKSSYYQDSPLGDPNVIKSLESKMQQPENRFNQQMTIEDVVNSLPRAHAEYTGIRIANNIKDAQSVIRQLPDVALAANIIVGAIMTAGLQTTAVTYESDLERTLPGLTEPLLKKISDHIEGTFALKKTLPKWIHDALVLEGAKPLMILPESTIDHEINGDLAVGLEAFDKQYRSTVSRQYGILGAPDGNTTLKPTAIPGLNADHPDNLHGNQYNAVGHRFTDNPEAIKLSRLKTRSVRDKITEIYLQNMSGFAGHRVAGGLNNDQDDQENPFAAAIRDQKTGKVTLKKSYYQDRHYRVKPVDMLKHPSTLEKPNVGHPVWMTLPMESVVPIFDPSDPTSHVAYYVVLDENHRPISLLSNDTNRLKTDYTTLANNDSLPSLFIRSADRGMSMDSTISGVNDENKESKYLDYQAAFELYTTIVWNDWSQRLENGVLGTSYNMAKPEGLMKLLFEMTLRKKRAQILLVPAELMVYFAYNYDDVGVGESLIEMSKTLASLRLVLLYSQTNMEFQASIPRRRLNMKIDPREPDKNAAIKMLYQNWILNQQSMMPVNIIDPVQLNQSVWRQAVEVNVESDPRYPQTALTVDPIQFDKREPDQQLTDRLQKLHNMGFGLTPEQIDTSLGDDRVTSRLLNNEMFRQRITVWKDITDFHITDLIQKYVLNSQPLMDDIRKAIKANEETIGKTREGKTTAIDVDLLAFNFVKGITVHLPNIEEEGIDDTEKKFSEYNTFIDELLNSQFDEQIWQAGNENARIEDIKLLKGMIKAILVQDWLAERGVMPDIAGLASAIDADKKVSPLIERAMQFIKKMAPIITKTTQELRAINDVMSEIVPARGGEVGQEEGSYGGEGGEGADEFSGGGFEDEFDLGGDEETTMEDETGTEEPSPEDTGGEEPPDEE